MFMKRAVVLLLMLKLSMFMANAEEPEVQKLEGEVRMGLTTPVGTYHYGKAQTSLSLALEGRYNIESTPLDVGFMIDLSTARRSYKDFFREGFDYWQNNRSLVMAVLGDYNFHNGTKVNTFVGAALGVAKNDVVGDECFPSSGNSLYFAPRIGIEFLYHIRLMTQLNLCRKGYNNLSISIGLVLGGRPKR